MDQFLFKCYLEIIYIYLNIKLKLRKIISISIVKYIWKSFIYIALVSLWLLINWSKEIFKEKRPIDFFYYFI